MVKRRGKAKKALKKIGSLAVMKPSHVISNTAKVHPNDTNDCYPLNKLCRLCLLSNTNMEPIFSFPGDERLVDKIFQCTNLKITENADQGIPTSICGQCKKQLDQCYEFRLLCWKNNEVLYNLHAILSPRNTAQTVARPDNTILPNPVVQLRKLNINSSSSQPDEIDLLKLYTPPKTGKRSNLSRRSFGEISLDQLYTPSRRGHKSSTFPRFLKELVVQLTPLSTTFINKYRKTVGSTKTKAAVKSFAQLTSPRGRSKSSQPATKAKPVAKQSPAVKTKIEKKMSNINSIKFSKTKPTPAVKKNKIKRIEIAVPPKKRKENFTTAVPTTVTCLLCSQTFISQKNLSRHMATHENNRKQKRIFNCDVCHKEYLKPQQLAEHLSSAEHIVNVVPNAPDEGIEESILPDNDEGDLITDDNPPVVTCDITNDIAEVEITDQSNHQELDRQQQSPDTNDISQNSDHVVENERQQPAESNEIEGEEPSASESAIIRDASPIPLDSESSRSRDGGVQYSDVCSTNNEENLFNGSSGTDVFNTSRRVTFSDITEVVD
ncbi:uncharacterized protein LOC131430869 isoform X2 [Malaya genurostris]|uniref:uncharacterized protein LOC131430869 isoform X2 n=1 Tax=Malaya genurostris TaxID=325434 RepID=UPI0026F394DC|nr:uncharacterized protein LOC131430869 isoform X2 [Malaya genurostris]